MFPRRDKVIFLGIFSLLLFLAFNRHSKHGPFNYHSEIWADKAGYHVYLPSTFSYQFDAKNFPLDLDRRTGSGFHLDTTTGKVITKYPMGVALLHSPFYFIGHVLETKFAPDAISGYSPIQHKMIDISTVFYTTLGLLLLFISLPGYTARKRYLLLFLLVFASNFYFYITRDAGLSHTYSFFIFAGFYSLLIRVAQVKDKPIYYAFIVILGSIGCLIRPTNVLFLLLSILLVVIPNWQHFKLQFKTILKGILFGLPLALFFVGLQLAYYKYAFGDYFAYSYTDESFIYALKPRIARVWFAPANGLFLYSPVYLLAIIGILKYRKVDIRSSIMYGLIFLAITYLYAAWWSPGLGCGYGHRGFIEFMPLFVIPILTTLQSIKSKAWAISLSILGLAYIAVLVQFQYHYDGCWYGNGYWDWNEVLLVLGIK